MTKTAPGEIVRDRREALSLSREHLARDCEISTSTVVRLELENRLPKALILQRITDRLDLSLEQLVQAAAHVETFPASRRRREHRTKAVS